MSNTTALDIEQLMAPDTQERYPSEEQVSRWFAEQDDPDFTATTAQKIAFIARKACDWQREQDALICEARYHEHVASSYASQAMEAADCADAIRTPPQPGAAQ